MHTIIVYKFLFYLMKIQDKQADKAFVEVFSLKMVGSRFILAVWKSDLQVGCLL